jgi:hypothetical protein
MPTQSGIEITVHPMIQPMMGHGLLTKAKIQSPPTTKHESVRVTQATGGFLTSSSYPFSFHFCTACLPPYFLLSSVNL